MRRIALAVAVLFAAGLFCGAANELAYAKELKIGYIDPGRIMGEYKKAQDVLKALEEKGKSKEAELKKMFDEIKKMQDEQVLLSEKARAEKQAAIDKKGKELQDFRRAAQAGLSKEENEILMTIGKEIDSVVAVYAKDKGYDMVIHRRVLLFAAPEHDLTGEILKSLNAASAPSPGKK